METLRIGETIQSAWETFKKRPFLFIGTTIVIAVATKLTNSISEAFDQGAAMVVGYVITLVISAFIGMGASALYLKAYETPEAASFRDLWHPQTFWKYVGMIICYSFVVFVPSAPFIFGGVFMAIGAIVTDNFGLLVASAALVIVGICIGMLLTTIFAFAMYLVIDRKLGPIESMKESARITKGNRVKLFVLILSLVGICILGLAALTVGLLVAVPVVCLAMIRAYRVLEMRASPVVAV